jgi:HAD domain in Swiss Army Knife RNA repair proteins
MQAKEPTLCASSPAGPEEERPLLMVDIDGVISLFGPPGDRRPEGSFHAIDGIPHFLSSVAAAHLLSLAEAYDLVWASGWEEKAEEYLPRLLGLPAGLPFLHFERSQGTGRSINGHWKLDAIDTYAGARPLAWVDDAFDESCHAWSAGRSAPTLLVQTVPADGLTSREALLLATWARELTPA